MQTAASLNVEMVVDLGQLDASLRRAEGNTTRSAGKIANDLGRVERATDRVNATSGRAATATERLAASYGRMSSGVNSAATASGRLAAANDNVARSANDASFAAKAMAGALAAISAAGIIALGTAVAQVGMQMQALERSFKAAAGGAEQGGRELTFVRAEADRLGLALGETAKQYLSMVAASQGTALQGQGTRDAFVAVSTAMTALGKGSEETGRALLAVQQMMSKGKVASEELKGQLGEVLPGAFNLAAQAAGKTTAEFSKMLDDGKVLADDLIPKLSKKLIELYGAAALEGAQGLQANINRLSTSFQDFANTIAQGGLNEALNRAAQALVRFMKEADGANIGRTLGAGIDWLVQALERVPRGFENLGIGVMVLRDLGKAILDLLPSFGSLDGAATASSSLMKDVFSGLGENTLREFNTIVGAAVAGYQMVAAAWQALPSVFAEIATNAGNALIRGIGAAVQYVVDLINGMITSINNVGAKLPAALGFSEITKIADVKFGEIENRSKGAMAEVGANLEKIGKDATSKDYFGGARDATKQFVDGQVKNFKDYRGAMDDAAREQRKFSDISSKSKIADAYKNVAAAGKAAKAANDDAGGSAKSAASAYDNLIQRTKDRIEELQLEAQYASKTATEVIKLKLAHDLERAAKKDGTEVTEAMRKEWDALGTSLADATQNLERTRKAQSDLKKAQDATADSLKSFVEDLLTGTDGINGALKNLGKTMVSSSLDAMISGKGSLAGIAGLAANDNNSQGGILGILAGLPKAVQTGAEKGSKAGTVDGVVNGLGTFSSGGGTNNLLGIDGKQLAGGIAAIAGLAGAYGAGAAASSPLQAGLGGALSGGMGGLALASTLGMSASVLGPIGAIVGVGLAMLGNKQAEKEKKKQQRITAENNYQNVKSDMASFNAQARGDPTDTLAIRIAEAKATAQKLADVAWVAGRQAEAITLVESGHIYGNRALEQYRAGFDGLIESLNSGMGPSGAFANAQQAMKDFALEAKAFISNTATAFGDGAPQMEQARIAAVKYALTSLDGAKSLSLVATRIAEIRGTAAGLTRTLADLGVSADDAAAAISVGVVGAMARLKASFEDDLGRRTLEAQDKGYINEASDLIKELATLRADAASLGSDQSLVTDYFKASAQGIVDGAQLTGDAFDDLIKRFPDLTGYVHAFSQAMDAASKAADIAARKLNYQDRLFNASNDNTTLTGQLAAYDRQAMREREDELKAGGEAIADLEAAQLVERFNIIRDFNQAANDNYRQSLEQAQDYIDKFRRTITEYLDGLRAGADSPLDPQARLAAAQSQYSTQLGLAQNGNREALDGITGYASDLLDAAKGFHASSSGFQTIFAQIQSQLGALPDQISAEQFIVNAIEAGADQTTDAITVMQNALKLAVDSGSASQIASALSTYFNKIDVNTDNTISFQEMANALGGMASNSSLRDMFTRLDTDASGSLTKLELIKNATAGTEIYSLQQKQVLDSLASVLVAANTLATTSNSLTQTSNALIDYSNLIGNTQSSILNAIQGLQGTSAATLAALNSQFSTNNSVSLNGVQINNNMREALNKIVFNTASTVVASSGNPGAPWVYASGGYVSGPGTGTSDSINARLSNGEFVMRAAAVDRIGVGALNQMNDNFSMPAMAVPVISSGGGDMSAVVAMLGKLIDRVGDLEAALCEAEAEGAALVADRVDGVRAVQIRSNVDMRQMANRPRTAGTRAA